MTVAEIMHQGVMTVQRSTSLQEVSSFFIEHGITGSPVVDDECVPIGVISMSDLTAHAAGLDKPKDSGYLQHLWHDDPPHVADLTFEGDVTAGDVMTEFLIRIDAGAEVRELLELMKAISSKQIGVCLDTGNSLALLESPLEVVRQLAPYTLTVHFKDIAVHLTEDGFEMAEVPLGQGIFDLPEMIRLIQTEAPEAEFHLEMMTRDPLSIPCLRESYWASFPNKPGTDLARTLTLVKARGLLALTHVSTLTPEACLVLEEKNIIDSIMAAGDKLGFSQMDLKALLKEE